MKRIRCKKKSGEEIEIETPWLGREDAARYLGVSPTMFSQFARCIPHGMDGKVKKYHVSVLDKFCAAYTTAIEGLKNADD